MPIEYISVKEYANRNGLSERTVRNYCAVGRIEGAILVGKTWSIPADAVVMAKKRTRKTTSNTGIPGLSFSWREFLGITKMKRKFTKETGIPTTKAGIERKIGRAVLDWIFGGKKEKE
ncbi:MAG: hypothetical protein Q4E68_06025 [Prevotellaceae bacterium]|nr:hypothetical protein [Prevotellaceae bacterium]